MKQTVTGMVLTFNGERLIDTCLRSLDFCDEILVVDSGSSDRTLEIAAKHGARVIHNDWPGHYAQFKFALDNVTTDWVVSLDQDEFLDDELKTQIMTTLATPEDLAGYYVPRKSWYMNRFMKHSGWYPDYLLRIYRTDRMDLTHSGAHQQNRPKGDTKKLTGHIIHYPYTSFSEHLHKINDYAEQGAKHLREKGRKGGLFRAMFHGAYRFFKLYFLKLGILDGKAGFVNACFGSFYAFQKYVRIDEDVNFEPYK